MVLEIVEVRFAQMVKLPLECFVVEICTECSDYLWIGGVGSCLIVNLAEQVEVVVVIFLTSV